MTPYEYRNLPGEVDGVPTVEVRAEDDTDGNPGTPVIHGYAAVFGRASEELGGFTEYVAPGAFTDTLIRADVVANWNHNMDLLMARMSSGTLRCAEDGRGLVYDFDPPPLDEDYVARRMVALLRRRDVTGSSFAFRTVKDEWVYDEEHDTVQRTLHVVDLIDVCPVARAAYLDTDAALRSLAEARSRPLAEVRSLMEHRSLGVLFGRPATEPPEPPESPEQRSDDTPPVRPFFFGLT